MSVKNTFREIAIKMSTKQPQMVDSLLEEAPILEMLPLQESSEGLQHTYEEVVDVTGAGLVQLDDVLPEADVTTKLEKVDMSVIAAEMFVGEDKAKALGGPGPYFASKQPAVLRKTGMDTETSILYNNLRAYAIANDVGLTGSHAIDATGVGDTNYSIIAVKWAPGECTGLYSTEGFGRGAMLEALPLNGGNLYKNSAGVNGYGIRLKSYFGMLTANPRNISTIVNIDLENDKLPTASQIDDVLDNVRAQVGGSTWLYMHPKVYTALFKYKADSLELVVGDNDIRRIFNSWNGIPIITSYNFMGGDEPAVVAV